MFTREQYELIDFGNGRRLERMGDLVIDRPCPVACGSNVSNFKLWKRADARFTVFSASKSACGELAASGCRGVWEPLSESGATRFPSSKEKADVRTRNSEAGVTKRSWTLSYLDKFVFELRGSPFGHVGVFPEQAENWDRIEKLCAEGKERLGTSIRVLNLFGYTGGSALAAARAGAAATHLDAARNIVAQARRNAEVSFGMASDSVALGRDAPFGAIGEIRWVVDDAVKYVKREVKRGSRYNGVILDPPSYGHGARGEVWRFSRDLEPLVHLCADLLDESFCFVLLTGHTRKYEYPTLEKILLRAFEGRFGGDLKLETLAKPLGITSRNGATLPAGDMALAVRRS